MHCRFGILILRLGPLLNIQRIKANFFYDYGREQGILITINPTQRACIPPGPTRPINPWVLKRLLILTS